MASFPKNKAARWLLIIFSCVVILIATFILRLGLGWPLWPGGLLVAILISLAANWGRQSKQ